MGFQCGAIIDSAAVLCLSVCMYAFLLGTYLGRELLHHWGCPGSAVVDITYQFSQSRSTNIHATCTVGAFLVSPHLAKTWHFPSFSFLPFS